MDHHLFLGTEKDAGDILGAFEKVRKLAASLRRIDAETAKTRFSLGYKVKTHSRLSGLVLVLTLLASPAAPQRRQKPLAPSSAGKYTAWTFREDFSKGIPGWMSFPLAQDVGYDPSIYTSMFQGAPTLVADVIAAGQRKLHIGMARPLRFHATPASALEFAYDLSASGRITRVMLTLGDRDGKRHMAAVPAIPGHHRVRVDGHTLGLPESGAEIELIVLEADSTDPVLGSHNRLTVEAFSVEAEQLPAVAIQFPQLVHSPGMGVDVAREWIRAGSPLQLRLAPGAGNVEITLSDGSGNVVKNHSASVASEAAIPLDAAAAPGLWRAQVRRGGAITDFRFLVLGDIPAHPRLLLTPERLNQLQSQDSSKALQQVFHQKASELAKSISYNSRAGDNITVLASNSVFPGLEAYFSLMENYSNAIAFNALDYRLTGSAESLESARRALLVVSDWPTWTPPWFAAHGLSTYYEVGVFTQRVAFGYDLIADRLSAPQREHIAEALLHKAVEPALQEYFWNDRMSIAASNHIPQSVGGAILACIATYGDVQDWNGRFAPALAQLLVDYENLLQGLFPGDGSGAEPTGYQNFAQEGMSWGMAALTSLGIRPRGTERMLEGFWFLRYITLRPDLLLGTGDSGPFYSLSGYAWAAEHSGDPAVRAFYEMAPSRTMAAFLRAQQQLGSAGEEYPGFLDLVCCSRASKPMPSAPPSRIFPALGSAALRSGWSGEDTLVSIRVGPWFNHEHHDQGNFQVAAFGETLIGEAGYSDYYRDPHYADYFTQALGHNTVLLDGDAFSQHSFDGRFWHAYQNHPRVERHLLGTGLDYLATDLAPAYDGALQKYTREFLFLKPSILIVRDRLQAKKPHRFSFLLHVPVGDQARATGQKAVVEGKQASAVIYASDHETRWTVEPVPLSADAYGDLDKMTLSQPAMFRLDSSRVSAAGFLVGMQFAKSSPENQNLRPLTTPARAQGFEARTAEGSAAAIFRNHPGMLAFKDFSTDGDILAVQESAGQRQVFAGQAKSVRETDGVLFSSSAAADVVLNRHSGEDVVELFAATQVNVKIFLQKPAQAVELDGQIQPRTVCGQFAEFRLTAGEHRVRINY
jgi:hypothetical protein